MASGSFGKRELHALLATNRWPPTTTHPPRALRPVYLASHLTSIWWTVTRVFLFHRRYVLGGALVGCRGLPQFGQDAGVELESSRNRQRWHLKEFDLTFQALPAVRT